MCMHVDLIYANTLNHGALFYRVKLYQINFKFKILILDFHISYGLLTGSLRTESILIDFSFELA